MPPGTEDKGITNAPPGGGAREGAASAAAAAGGGVSASNPVAATAAGATALAVQENEANEALPDSRLGDVRLERLPMQVDVMVKVRSFRVQDLLAMQKGTVVETVHEHTQDVPLCCAGALLLWSEFEVLDQRLAVRVTRLA
jgi:flagellar motor switch/type III secretory pathway protein FliN